MSTTPPPDRPIPPPADRATEPLHHARPAAVPPRVAAAAPVPVVEERVVAPVVDPNVILLRLEDAVDGLRTWLFVIGLVAVVALGVALYAVIDDDTSTRGAGSSATGLASDERVTQIENRVDRLSRQLQDLRVDRGTAGGTSALAGRVDQLERTVRSLPSQPSAGGTQDAIDTLSNRIDTLAQDVEQLKQAGTTTP
jgi:outer membrane murein-binding lipoprotein Lpp